MSAFKRSAGFTPTSPVHVNAALLIGSNIFLFLGDWCAAYSTVKLAMVGLPKRISAVFAKLDPDFATGIDAAVNWGPGAVAYLFKGNQYVRIDTVKMAMDDGYPRPIKGNWPPNPRGPALSFDSIDAALNWGDGKVYFFSGTQYVRYSQGGSGQPEGQDSGYPKPIRRQWTDLAFDSVDAAVEWGDGNTYYFFKADKYVRYLKNPEKQEFGYPRAIKGSWVTGCQVIGHHGAQRDAPENTRETLVEAYARGADVVEVDLRVSLDGVPVLIHDDTLWRTAGDPRDIGTLRLEQLKSMNVGNWQNISSGSVSARRNWTKVSYPGYPANPQFDGARIPTLAEALLAAQSRGIIYADMKVAGAAQAMRTVLLANDPTLGKYPVYIELEEGSVGDIAAYTKIGLGPAAARVGWQIIIWLTKSIPVTSTRPTSDQLNNWRALGIRGFDIRHSDVKGNRSAVLRLRQEGFLVFIYEVNDDLGDHEQAAIDLGVDGVLTDEPTMMSLLGISQFEADPRNLNKQP